MVKKIFPVLVCFVTLMILVSSLHGQGSKKTITLPSGEVVCNLNGGWNVSYEHYGPLQWVGNLKGMIMIIQQGNTFVGKTSMATGWTPAGTEKIRGELDNDSIKKAQLTRPDKPWANCNAELSKGCDKIVCDDTDGLKMILEKNSLHIGKLSPLGAFLSFSLIINYVLFELTIFL